jgi:hypothetical protein
MTGLAEGFDIFGNPLPDEAPVAKPKTKRTPKPQPVVPEVTPAPAETREQTTAEQILLNGRTNTQVRELLLNPTESANVLKPIIDAQLVQNGKSATTDSQMKKIAKNIADANEIEQAFRYISMSLPTALRMVFGKKKGQSPSLDKSIEEDRQALSDIIERMDDAVAGMKSAGMTEFPLTLGKTPQNMQIGMRKVEDMEFNLEQAKKLFARSLKPDYIDY